MNWYAKFTHAIAGIMTTLAGFYAVSQSFRDWVAALTALYAAHVPHVLQPVPALMLALYMWYRKPESQKASAPAATDVAAKIGSSVLCITVLSSAVLLSGCSSLEKQAYKIAVGAKAFTQNISAKHPECGSRDTSGLWVPSGSPAGVCVSISKAIAAKDLLIDAAEIYCAGPEFEAGGACNAPTDKTLKEQLIAKVQAAIHDYEQTEADLRAALK